jgi:hypothetical protein
MARFPAKSSGLAHPYKERAELTPVLFELHVARSIDDRAADEIYSKLATIIGKWFAEQERVEIEPVAKALLRTAKNLSEISLLMSGRETGFRTGFEIAVASQLGEYLALDPTIGSEAHDLMASFREQAAQISHVCMVGYADLSDKAGKQGRLALDWYDDFTALLLSIAVRSGIEPALQKDRVTRVRSGWLFDAAQAFEMFLYPHMRSPSAEACGKRLERSLKRLPKSEQRSKRLDRSHLRLQKSARQKPHAR